MSTVAPPFTPVSLDHVVIRAKDIAAMLLFYRGVLGCELAKHNTAIGLYHLRVGPLPVRWRTRIARWEPGRSFVDCQEAGPYRLWWHEHLFLADNDRTIMEDRVSYTPPFGMLGRLANRLFIGSHEQCIECPSVT